MKATSEQIAELSALALARGGTVGGGQASPAAKVSNEGQAAAGAVFLPAKGHALEPLAGMNKLESAYAAHLELRKRAGEVAWWGYEAVKLRLADRTFYTPDFFVMLMDGLIEFHETKGFMRDDAAVKLKVAAAQFPMFTFWVARKIKGGWHEEKV